MQRKWPQTQTKLAGFRKVNSTFKRQQSSFHSCAVASALSLCVATLSWLNIGCFQSSYKQSTETKSIETAKKEVSEQTTEQQLREIVRKLSQDIGPRNLAHFDALNQTADFLESQFKQSDYEVLRQSFDVQGFDCHNLLVELKGTTDPEQILMVGAHYDSCLTTPGANDNGTGIAALLVIARQLTGKAQRRTIRFVAWTNEEPPYFQRADKMGSLIHTRACHKAIENIVGVVALETMGYYSDEPKSQKYPPLLAPLYPDTGNFLGFVSNLESRELLSQTVKSFKSHTDFPCESASLPSLVDGVGWSDHWSYWQVGYPGIMITDTAPFRYPHYHQETDTIDKISFDRLAKITDTLTKVIIDLSDVKPTSDNEKTTAKTSQ